jgi:hypothetical protein
MIKLKEIIESFNEPIPPVLYHATFNALVPSIQKHGLIPHGTTIRNFDGAEWGVYLSDNESFAGSMVQAGTENEDIPDEWLDEVVICVIDTGKFDTSNLDKDPHVNMSAVEDEELPKSYIYKGTIPASAITEIKDFVE